jgi:hypothetical protein
MLLVWLKGNIATMGWFFELKLSKPTLDVFTKLTERKMQKDRPVELIVNR